MKYLTPEFSCKLMRLLQVYSSMLVLVLPASSCVRLIQSSMSFLYLNHEVGPSKSGGIFTIIPLDAVHLYVASARYASLNEIEKWEIWGTWDIHRIFLTVAHWWTTILQRDLVPDKIFNNYAPLPLCGCKEFCMCNSFVTRKLGNTQPRTHTRCVILFSPRSILTIPSQ